MDKSRLTICTNGAFAHPMDGLVPIDVRYSETIQSPHLAHKALQSVGWVPKPVDVGPRPARCVLIVNTAGTNYQTYPDEATAARIARQVLIVCDSAKKPLCELPPAVPGSTPMGCGQHFWLAEGAELYLQSKFEKADLIARVVAFPRSDVSAEMNG